MRRAWRGGFAVDAIESLTDNELLDTTRRGTFTKGTKMTNRRFLYIPNAVVRAILTPEDSVRIARETLEQMAAGEIDWAEPRQTNLVVGGDEHDGDYPAHLAGGTAYKIKGCALRRQGIAGFRIVGLNRSESGYAVAAYRPTKNVLLSDISSGELFGIVDERWAYALRTGACAAVAIDSLRRSDADELALVATGHMAYAAALTISKVVPLKRVRAHSRDPERRSEFAKRLSLEIGVEVEPVADAESCLRGAPMVVSATTAKNPFLKHEWLAQGAVVYAMGGGHEWERETYRHCRVIVDDREQSRIVTEIKKWTAEGSFDPDTEIEADLGAVVTGAVRRTDDREQFFVRSQGLVTQDVAQANWIYNQAAERGLGVDLEHSLIEKPGDALF